MLLPVFASTNVNTSLTEDLATKYVKYHAVVYKSFHKKVNLLQ